MAARAYWQGQIRLALVSIPVQVFPATRTAARISFNQIHKPSGKRIRYRAIVLHLDHPRGYDRPESIARNRAIRAETKRNRAAWTEHGLAKGPAPR